ncbi:MAG: RNA methyltransferase [Armatimonadetes bacterium]|nr:RNA methyltransferase [Armatimonadota bacterium]
MMQRISGQKDPIMKMLRELVSEDGRKRANRFFAEGDELARRAFDYGGGVESLILTDKFAAGSDAQALLERVRYAGIEAYQCTEGLIAKILDAKPTPECLAIVERKVCSLNDVFNKERPLVQMVEACENADNLGMLLRSTDAAGVTGVVLAAETTDPFSRRVVRGSRGAVFTVPICVHPDPATVIAEARGCGLQVIATSAKAEISYTDIDYTKPTMIVVGNEHTGISETVRELSDAIVRIPMRGMINSLNIAVAASMLMYEAVRQRGLATPPSSRVRRTTP